MTDHSAEPPTSTSGDASLASDLDWLKRWSQGADVDPADLSTPTATPPSSGTPTLTPGASTQPDPLIDQQLRELRRWQNSIGDDQPVAAPPAAYPPSGAATATTNAAVPDEPSEPFTARLAKVGPWLVEAGQKTAAWLHLDPDTALAVEQSQRRGLVPESVIVLGLSLGASAVWAILSLINMLTQLPPGSHLNDTTVQMNNPYVVDRPWLDLTNQLAHIVLMVVPVALVFYLLARVRPPAEAPFKVMGIKWPNVPKDLVIGLALAAGIGIPGLGLYALARLLGINATIAAGNLGSHWWAIPVYVLLAAMNGLLEEVVMVGYLFTRWAQRGLGPWVIIVVSALIRGTYHLYQGFGGFIGNFIMGAIFGWVYTRTKRVLPLVIAHTLLDVASFVGYALLSSSWHWLQ